MARFEEIPVAQTSASEMLPHEVYDGTEALVFEERAEDGDWASTQHFGGPEFYLVRVHVEGTVELRARFVQGSDGEWSRYSNVIVREPSVVVPEAPIGSMALAGALVLAGVWRRRVRR